MPDECKTDAGGHEREVRDEGERVVETGTDRGREAGRPGRPGGAALTCRTRGAALPGGTGHAGYTRRATLTLRTRGAG